MKNNTKIIVDHTFTKDDFVGLGQYIIKCREINPTVKLEAVIYKVGYEMNSTNTIALISMSDGAVCSIFSSMQEFIKFLNAEQKYRLATRDEVVKMVSGQTKRHVESYLDLIIENKSK